MSKNELVSCFQDTLRMCENGKLKQLTEQAKESTKVSLADYSRNN